MPGALWPGLILLVGAGAAWSMVSGPALQQVVTLGYLLIGPGLAVVRAAGLRDGSAAMWALACATSLALAALVAGVMLYGGIWSARDGLLVLVVIGLLAVSVEVVRFGQQPRQGP